MYSFCGAASSGSVAASSRDAAVSQHDNVVGHLRDDREVVGHVDARDLALTDHLLERAQHFDLRRDVERRRRLVEDHQRRDR